MKGRGQQESGATMVEFSLSLIVIIALLALIFDAGFMIWGYTALTETAAEIASDRSIHLDSDGGMCSSLGIAGLCETCADVGSAEALCNNAHEIGIRRFRVFLNTDDTGNVGVFGNVAFGATAEDSGFSGSDRFIRVDAVWNYSCLFCQFFGSNIRIRTSTLAQAERTLPVACGLNFACPL